MSDRLFLVLFVIVMASILSTVVFLKCIREEETEEVLEIAFEEVDSEKPVINIEEIETAEKISREPVEEISYKCKKEEISDKIIGPPKVLKGIEEIIKWYKINRPGKVLEFKISDFGGEIYFISIHIQEGYSLVSTYVRRPNQSNYILYCDDFISDLVFKNGEELSFCSVSYDKDAGMIGYYRKKNNTFYIHGICIKEALGLEAPK